MKKYTISEEFGILKKVIPPFNKTLFRVAELVLTERSKYLKSDDEVDIFKEQIKTDDGKFINLYVYEPKKIETDKILLYIHGGGFVYEGNSTHYKHCRRYALEGNCKVVYVDYRRAPKYCYPIPGNDCFSAYKWIIDNADKLNIDINKIIIGGDSAGGCLAVDTALRAIKEKIAVPCYQLLIYPVLDKRMITKSMQEFTDTPMWNAKLNKKMWKVYLKDQEYISPNEADNLNMVPDTYIETAEFDCLHDEGIVFADKLRKSGIKVQLNETKETMHGFDMVNCEITENAVKQRIEVLKSVE